MENHDPAYCTCSMCLAIRKRTRQVLEEELEVIKAERANMTPRQIDRLYHGSWDYNDMLDEHEENVSRETLPTYIHLFIHADRTCVLNGVKYRALRQEDASGVSYCCLERVQNGS